VKTVLTKRNGTLVPDGGEDCPVLKMSEGESVMVDIIRKRNVGHHRKAFALLNEMFSNQDEFEDREVYRKALKLRLGEMTEVFDGAGVFELKSWAFDEMGQEEFDRTYSKIIDYCYEHGLGAVAERYW